MCFFEVDRFDMLISIFCNVQDHKLDWDTVDIIFNGLFLNYALLKKWGLVIVETVWSKWKPVLFFHSMHIKSLFAGEQSNNKKRLKGLKASELCEMNHDKLVIFSSSRLVFTTLLAPFWDTISLTFTSTCSISVAPLLNER